MFPLVDLDQVHNRDVPLSGIAGHIPLKHSNHVIRYIAVVVGRPKRPVEADLPCRKSQIHIMSNVTEHFEEAIVESLKAVPVDICHLKKGELAATFDQNLVGDDPKKEGNKSLSVFIPRRRVGSVDIVEGNLDILPPMSVFAFSMEISIVA